MMPYVSANSFVFFFNDAATTEIYTLSLHDALPIYVGVRERELRRPRLHIALRLVGVAEPVLLERHRVAVVDRKSTRLNSSHANISYAVFCLKKKTPSQLATITPHT